MDRRQRGRWDGRVSIDLEDPSGIIFEAVGLNISTGGLCLIFPAAPAPTVGAIYGVSFRLPTLKEPVVNTIAVRWIDILRAQICGAAFLKGLRAREVFTLNELLALDRNH